MDNLGLIRSALLFNYSVALMSTNTYIPVLYHDSAAALLHDDKLVAAQEERFSCKNHAALAVWHHS